MTTKTRNTEASIGRKRAAELFKLCVDETGVDISKTDKVTLITTMSAELCEQDALTVFSEFVSAVFEAPVKRDSNGNVKKPEKAPKWNGHAAIKRSNESYTLDTDIFSFLKASSGMFEARYDVETGTKAGRSDFNVIKNEIYSSLQKLDGIKIDYKTIRWLLDSAFMTGINTLDKASGGDGLVTFDDFLRCKKFNYELYQKWRKAGDYRQLALQSALRDGLKEAIKQANSMQNATLLDELCGDLLYEHGMNLFPQKPNESSGKWENQLFTEWFDEEQEKNRCMNNGHAQPLTTI